MRFGNLGEVAATVALGNIDLSELLRRRPAGEPVNTHVVEATPEPQPDFEAMRKLVHGDESSNKAIQEAEKAEGSSPACAG
jgi:hypothetical protein